MVGKNVVEFWRTAVVGKNVLLIVFYLPSNCAGHISGMRLLLLIGQYACPCDEKNRQAVLYHDLTVYQDA